MQKPLTPETKKIIEDANNIGQIIDSDVTYVIKEAMKQQPPFRFNRENRQILSEIALQRYKTRMQKRLINCLKIKSSKLESNNQSIIDTQ